MATSGPQQPRPGSDFEALTEIYKRRSELDLTEQDREALFHAQGALARWTKIGFFTGALGLPLILLRGRYAVRNLRKLPPLSEAGRPNKAAIKDRLWFFAKGSGLGVLGGFVGGSLGMMYGRTKVKAIIADAGATDRVKEYQRRVMQEMKEEMEPRMRDRRHRRSNSPPDGTQHEEGPFVQENAGLQEPETVDDRSFEANRPDGSSQPPFSSSKPPPPKLPSRWEAIRQDRSAKPSTWDRIRQDHARQAPSLPPPDDRERTESSTYDPRPNVDKEREKREFEELLDRERRMGEDAAPKDDKWL